MTTEQMTGAQALVRALEHVGVDTVFGIPGGAILPAYDPLFDSEQIRHILVRHEQGAGHAAAGLRAGDRQGRRLHGDQSGPGATNLVTPIADAYMDSVPIVAITGQVPSALIGTDAFQEADIRGITMPITKHNFLVTDPDDIARGDRRGVPHRLAPAGPARCSSTSPRTRCRRRRRSTGRRSCDLPGYRPVTQPHAKQIREAARLIADGRAPGALRRRRRAQGRARRPSCGCSPSSPASRSSPR